MKATRIKGRTAVRLTIGASLMLLLAGCGQPDGLSAEQLNNAYTSALAKTDAAARVLDRESGAEAETLARMQAYFTDMTPEKVRASTVAVYADNAWLYDNIAVVEGLANVEAYLGKAAEETDALTIEFLQVANTGVDYFIRWRMTITAAALGEGEPVDSYGVTQFRFNEDGRVILHRDFWDASTGMYESLPFVGGLIASLRNKLAAMPAAPK